MQKADFEKVLTERLQCTYVDVEDISGGCGTSFKVFIVSPLFEGKGLLQRQRLVFEKIKEEMKQIHALQFKKCVTPAQFEEMKAKGEI